MTVHVFFIVVGAVKQEIDLKNGRRIIFCGYNTLFNGCRRWRRTRTVAAVGRSIFFNRIWTECSFLIYKLIVCGSNCRSRSRWGAGRRSVDDCHRRAFVDNGHIAAVKRTVHNEEARQSLFKTSCFKLSYKRFVRSVYSSAVCFRRIVAVCSDYWARTVGNYHKRVIVVTGRNKRTEERKKTYRIEFLVFRRNYKWRVNIHFKTLVRKREVYGNGEKHGTRFARIFNVDKFLFQVRNREIGSFHCLSDKFFLLLRQVTGNIHRLNGYKRIYTLKFFSVFKREIIRVKSLVKVLDVGYSCFVFRFCVGVRLGVRLALNCGKYRIVSSERTGGTSSLSESLPMVNTRRIVVSFSWTILNAVWSSTQSSDVVKLYFLFVLS